MGDMSMAGTEDLSYWDNPDLISAWAAAKECLEEHRERMGRVEMELRRRMDQDQATELFHADWVIKIEPAKPEYNQPKLIAKLEEALPPECFEDCYVAEAVKTVPAHINMTRAKKYRSLGAEVVEAIEESLLDPMPGRLRINPRNTARC